MKIVGISACPAGLAHTPMAAKALEKAGKEMGLDVKMEQQGSQDRDMLQSFILNTIA